MAKAHLDHRLTQRGLMTLLIWAQQILLMVTVMVQYSGLDHSDQEHRQ